MKSLKLNIRLAQSIPVELIQTPKDKTRSECSDICKNIYLSGFNFSVDENFLRQNKFTHIINCAIGSKNFQTQTFSQIDYLLLDLKDEPGFDLIYSIYLATEFIEKAIRQNGKLLIHCYEVN